MALTRAAKQRLVEPVATMPAPRSELPLSLDKLPNDVIYMILDILYCSHPQAIQNLLFVSRALYGNVLPYYYRHARFMVNFNVERVLKHPSGHQRLSNKESASRLFIQDLVIDGYATLKRGYVDAVADVISNLPNLKHLSWIGFYHLPQQILDAIAEHNPSLQLTINPNHTSRADANADRDAIELLKTCRAPMNVHELVRCDWSEVHTRMLTTMLKHPYGNIRKLSGIFEHECVSSLWKPGFTFWLFRDGDGLHLDLQDDSIPPLVEEMEFFDICGKDMRKWRELGGWPHLRSLTLRHPGRLINFADYVPKLTALRIFKASYRGKAPVTPQRPWEDLVQGLGPLEELTYGGELNLDNGFLGTLSSYSDTLKVLKIMGRLEDWTLFPELPKVLPKLEILHLNFGTFSHRPDIEECIPALGAFPQLRHLTIKSLLVTGTSRFASNKPDAAFMQGICDSLVTNKVGAPFQSITFEHEGQEVCFTANSVGDLRFARSQEPLDTCATVSSEEDPAETGHVGKRQPQRLTFHELCYLAKNIPGFGVQLKRIEKEGLLWQKYAENKRFSGRRKLINAKLKDVRKGSKKAKVLGEWVERELRRLECFTLWDELYGGDFEEKLGMDTN